MLVMLSLKKMAEGLKEDDRVDSYCAHLPTEI